MTKQRKRELIYSGCAIVGSIVIAFAVAVILGLYFDPYPMAKLASMLNL